jgi:hypothetical protein
MSDKEIKKLTDLAKQKLEQNLTREQALASLVAAGILDTQGKYTKPYRRLASKDK